MLNITEKDLVLLMFAVMSENDIKNINKPLLQMVLYSVLTKSEHKSMLKYLSVNYDPLIEENRYVDLTNAFDFWLLRGVLCNGLDNYKHRIIVNILTKEEANIVIDNMKRKYAYDYSLLAEEVINNYKNKHIIYSDSVSKTAVNNVFKKLLTQNKVK